MSNNVSISRILKREIFSLEYGSLVIDWPCPMNESDVTDALEFIALVARKIANQRPLPQPPTSKSETKEEPK